MPVVFRVCRRKTIFETFNLVCPRSVWGNLWETKGTALRDQTLFRDPFRRGVQETFGMPLRPLVSTVSLSRPATTAQSHPGRIRTAVSERVVGSPDAVLCSRICKEHQTSCPGKIYFQPVWEAVWKVTGKAPRSQMSDTLPGQGTQRRAGSIRKSWRELSVRSSGTGSGRQTGKLT